MLDRKHGVQWQEKGRIGYKEAYISGEIRSQLYTTHTLTKSCRGSHNLVVRASVTLVGTQGASET